MKKAFIILIAGLNLLSCTFSQKLEDKNKDFFAILEESLKRKNYVIPDSLFSFFPDKSDNHKYLKIGIIHTNAEKTETSFRTVEFAGYRIVETYQCENMESLQQLMKEYRSQSMFTVNSENKDYFVIDNEEELLKHYDTLQLKENYLKAKDRIILSFKKSFSDTPFLYDTTTINGLPAGYEILVLKSGCDFVLPQERLYEWSVLPDNLKHGYRSGVAFKEGEPYIIYWVVTW
jgi:hypothetical protein